LGIFFHRKNHTHKKFTSKNRGLNKHRLFNHNETNSITMKSNPLKHSLLFILLIATISLSAQDNLLEGYIMTHKGETIHGYIDAPNVNIGTNQTQIKFRKLKEDKGEIYDPYSIQAYSINGEVYEGGFVDVELSPRDLDNLNTTPELLIQKELVFLQAIVRGEKSLYVYKNTGYDLFYIKRDSVFELLVYKKYLGNKQVHGRTSKVVYENKNYLQQLNSYLTGCPKRMHEIASTRYNQEELSNLFLLYYNCTKEEFRSFAPKKKTSLRIGIMTSISLTSMDFNYVISNSLLEHEAQRTLALGFNVNGRLSPRVKLIGEFFTVVGYGHHLPTDHYLGPNYTVDVEHNYGASSKKINVLGRYTIPMNKFEVFGNAGFSFERIKGVYTRVQTTTSSISASSHSYPSEAKISTYHLLAGAGVKYSRFSLEVRVEPRLIESYVGNSTSFILGYTFGSAN
jgi:hypothetical protein